MPCDVLSAGEIAAQLNLSQRTVRNYLSEANGKLGVGRRISVRWGSGPATRAHAAWEWNAPAREHGLRAGEYQHGDQLAVYGIEVALKLIAEPSAPVTDRETPGDLITAADVK